MPATAPVPNPLLLTPRIISVLAEHKDRWFTRKELAILIGSRNYDRVRTHLGVLEQENKIISKADETVPFFRKLYKFNSGVKKCQR